MQKEFWMEKEKLRIENDKFWAELSLAKEGDTGRQYIKVIGGDKRKEQQKKFHWNTFLDQSTKYVDDRGILLSINRQVNSEKHGHVSNERIVYNDDEDNPIQFTLELTIDGNTREVKVEKFELD